MALAAIVSEADTRLAPSAALAQRRNGRPVPNRPEDATPALPEVFWERATLAHIRQAAHARQRSAEAVLHSVLARVAGITPHTTTLPAIVATRSTLSYFAAVVAKPGVGKTSANGIATELVPAPDYVVDHVPVGSGEGLAEILYDTVSEDGPDGKRQTVRRQTRHNAVVFVDEGDVLGQLARRTGSTLLPTLRSIWTGASFGQANATTERHRVIPTLSAVFGVVLGLQPLRAVALLDDADAGLPQRFGWCLATDATVPDVPPDWPGRLRWEPPPVVEFGGDLVLAPAIVDEIRAADLARVRDDEDGDELDAHADLYRLKVAALLAVLEDRRSIGEDDWRLAGMVRAQSARVRAGVVAAVAAESARREQATTDRHARRAVATDDAVVANRILGCARRIAAKVEAQPGRWTAKSLRVDLRRWRDEFADGLDWAVAAGWVNEVTETGQGAERRSLYPGPARPL